MYTITKTAKNRTKIPNKLKATLFLSQSSLEELSTLSAFWCSISVEKSWVFDIETDKDGVEGFVEYILGEPIKKFPMNLGFDMIMSDVDVSFATQTGIKIICSIIIMYEHT